MTDPDCLALGPRLSALLDDELPYSARSALELHLKSCLHCTAELEMERHAREVLRSAATHMVAPAHLRHHVPLALLAASRRRTVWHHVLPFAGVAAALMLAAALAALLLTIRAESSQQFLARVRRAHQQETLSSAPVSFASDNPVAVRVWLRQQGSAEIDVPELGADGFQLVGARLDPAIAPHAVTLVYAGPEGIVSCAIIPARVPSWLAAPLGRLRPGVQIARETQTEVASWVESNDTYVLAGDLQPAVLLRLAHTVGASGPGE